MGTLLNQTERDYLDVEYDDVVTEIDEIKKLASEKNITFEQVLEVKKLMEEQRKIDLLVNDRDRFDEQMAGLGKMLETFNYNFDRLVDVFEGGLYEIKDKLAFIGERIDLK